MAGAQQQQHQHQLGRRVGRRLPPHRRRLGCRDRHPDGDASLPQARGAGLGRQLHAQHPPQERAGVLGADLEGVHPDPRQPRRHHDRHRRRQPRSGSAHDALYARGRPTGSRGGHRRGRRPRRLGIQRLRSRRQVRRCVWPQPGSDAEHRLRAGRGGRTAGEPDALSPLLSGEAGFLPGERRDVQRRGARERVRARRRPVLHAADRPVGRRSADPDHRRRAAHRESRPPQRRRDEYHDRVVRQRGRQLLRGALQPRHPGALEGRRDRDRQAGRRQRVRARLRRGLPLQPHVRGRHDARRPPQPDDDRLRRQDPRPPA